MILQAYAVFDTKAEAYLQPFFMRSRGEAMRAFMDSIQDEKHTFSRHAVDYKLMYIGLFDDSSGVIQGINTGPELVMSGAECMRVEE